MATDLELIALGKCKLFVVPGLLTVGRYEKEKSVCKGGGQRGGIRGDYGG
jgi:hypothetical protein